MPLLKMNFPVNFLYFPLKTHDLSWAVDDIQLVKELHDISVLEDLYLYSQKPSIGPYRKSSWF